MGGIIRLASFPKSGNAWMRSFPYNLLRNPTESYDINTLTDFTLGEAQTRWFKQFDPRPGSQYSLAGAIYIVRDPRDVAISYSHHQGQSLDFIRGQEERDGRDVVRVVHVSERSPGGQVGYRGVHVACPGQPAEQAGPFLSSGRDKRRLLRAPSREGQVTE